MGDASEGVYLIEIYPGQRIVQVTLCGRTALSGDPKRGTDLKTILEQGLLNNSPISEVLT